MSRGLAGDTKQRFQLISRGASRFCGDMARFATCLLLAISAVLFLSVSVHGSTTISQARQADACSQLLPVTVRRLVESTYPGAHIASLNDYSAEDIRLFRGEKQDCPGIARADVNGDGRPDFGVIVTSKQKHVLVLAAVSQAVEKWRLDLLIDWGREGRGSVAHSTIYVSRTAPGTYRDMFTVDPAPSEYVQEPGRVRTFHAKRDGFVFGGIEASGVAYFLKGRRWVHLWVSD